MQKLLFLQKKAIRIIAKADYLANTKPLFLEHKILTVNNLFNYKIMSLMWDFHFGFLPTALSLHFNNAISHQYETRGRTKSKLNSIKFKTKKFGKNSFKNIGTKLYNTMMDNNIFSVHKSKKCFLKNLKSQHSI